MAENFPKLMTDDTKSEVQEVQTLNKVKPENIYMWAYHIQLQKIG